MLWALVIYAATNVMSDTDSVALTTVHGIPTQQACEEGGRKASKMADGSYKTIKYICVPTAK